MPAVEHANLEIEAGQCLCLTGLTGSGKTTLALAIKDLLPSGDRSGEIRLGPGGGMPPRVGVVLQNPETQLLGTTVGAEVAFGLENLCVEPEQMPGRAEAALAATHLDRPLDFEVAKLSMGQKYRLLVAAALVMEPELLVLDEPSAQLDPEGLAGLMAVITGLKAEGVAFLLCEQHPERVAEVVDSFRELGAPDGRRPARPIPDRDGLHAAPARADAPPAPGPGGAPCVPETGTGPTAPELRDSSPAPEAAPSSSPDGQKEAVFVDSLRYDAAGGELWDGLSFGLRRGQGMAVCGPNGAGKTTLLRCLAGFVRPTSGQVRVLGQEPQPQGLRHRVGCLYQNPARQLFESTVFDEVAFSLRRMGAAPGEGRTRVQEILARCGIADLAGQSPHKLSYGQKHLVGLASVLAHEPELLLLDDPFAGLDPEKTTTILQVIRAQCQERGAAALWTTHAPATIPAWTDGVIYLRGEGDDD